MGQGILQTWSRLLSDQWPTINSRKPWWSLRIHEALRWSVNIVSHFFCVMILDIVRGQINDISISCSPWSYKSFKSFMTLHPLWPSRRLASFIDATITEWAQSIYPSPGWTNPSLGAHTSTYSIECPIDTFSQFFYGTDSWCNQSSLRI
jgi:hypothetical protein